ncbi:hypothetical protein F183_A15250 [Bryobacterales bacterium F-183]|nr:hypothetical protein F183_A15250 [Bryobacterales bacterium F-183]
MDQQTLLYIMTAFVVLAGIAMAAQAVAIIALYKGMKVTQEKVAAMIPKVEGLVPMVENVVPKVERLVESSQSAIDQSRAQILEITGKTVEILDTARVQLNRVDSLVSDATSRARVQLERAEAVVEDTLTRAQETVGVVHSGVMKPLREIQGVTAGVKTALAFLAKGTRPSVNQVTQDEEMFI